MLRLSDLDDSAGVGHDTPHLAEATAPTTPPTSADHTRPADIPSDLQQYLDEQERQVLLRALQECQYNRTAAAARLGLNLRQIRYRIQRLGIVVPGSDDAD